MRFVKVGNTGQLHFSRMALIFPVVFLVLFSQIGGMVS